MVFACCFGGGGDGVLVQGRSQTCGAAADQAIVGKTAKAQEFADLPSGATIKTANTFLSGNTTSLSAVTLPDNSSAAYQLNILNTALASLSGNWYERVSSAANRLSNLAGAAICSVSILDGSNYRFTVVHVTGKDAQSSGLSPAGSHLPALPAAHQAVPNAGTGLHYNSVQVLQVLQSPLLYSFSDPIRASREMTQPPHDWLTIYEGTQSLSDFCALPLMYEKSIVGAVTLVFSAPSGSGRQQLPGQQLRTPAAGVPAPPASLLMACDEQSLRTMGLLLSVVLVGQDLQLAQQVADILAGVYEARNLQQVVTVVTAGAEQVLQLTTRVLVASNLAMLVAPTGPAGATAASGASGPTSNTGGGGRAIFFEERGGSRAECSTQGTNISRSMPSMSEPFGSGSGVQQAHAHLNRSRLQRSHTPMEAQGGVVASAGNPAVMVSPRGRNCNAGPGGPQIHPSLRPNGAASSSHDSASAANGGSLGGLLWQAGMVQARALGLRHTLLANLPPTGTIVHDCASYMQQVGCPKRDLYLLSTCQGAAPFALVLAPAPLKEGDPTQLVLYVAVAMRLPMELLNELLSQAQLLASRVLAPLLQQKLMHGNLADEWALLQGKCSSGRSPVPAPGPPGPADPRSSSSALRAFANGAATGGKEGPSGSTGTQPGASAIIVASSSSPGGSGTASDDTAPANGAEGTGEGALPGGNAAAGGPRGRYPQLPAGLTAPPGHVPDALPFAEAARGGVMSHLTSTDVGAGSRVLMPLAVASQESHATVLSTAVGGAFAGDTRTHMGMLVASFKDTINALQAFRAEEAEELSVLKLGKVLGRGGSGLVFQGYLHLGLEVAVKLFENPDDTDPDAASAEDGGAANQDSSSAGPESAPAAAAEAGGSKGSPGAKGEASPHATGGNDKDQAGASKDSSLQATARRNSSKTAAQMTKRQRDLLRNALELGVTSSLSHPNVVQGYCHWVNVVLMQDASLNRCWLMGQAEYMALAPPGSPPPPLCSALVMEYCDMGSLIHALKRGTFTATESKSNMEFVYMCLLEIALALRHLHTAKLAHCDLKPGNVLLRSSPRDPRGFVCKLGDFGYAAILKDGLLPGRPAVLPDEACGTLQYMAPELFVAGRPVDASIDIYAFGMLMWELMTGKTPYSDNEYGSRALMKAVYHGKRPIFPDTTLASYKNLGMCCWSGDPNLRPSASVLVKLLRQQLESLKQLSGSTSSGSTGVRV